MSIHNSAYIIKVRRVSGDAYAATCAGKRSTCTFSPEVAAERVAEKLFGDGTGVQQAPLDEGDAAKGVTHCYTIVMGAAA